MNRSSINQGTADHISLRWKAGLLITPSGVTYDEMTLDDIVFMNMDRTSLYRSPPAIGRLEAWLL